MKIALFHHRPWRIEKGLFKKSIEKIDAHFPGARQATIHLVFVDDPTIRDLNRRYLGRDYPTDVLSFAYGEKGFLGELYISMDTLKRQAGEHGQALKDELNKIFVHGF